MITYRAAQVREWKQADYEALTGKQVQVWVRGLGRLEGVIAVVSYRAGLVTFEFAGGGSWTWDTQLTPVEITVLE